MVKLVIDLHEVLVATSSGSLLCAVVADRQLQLASNKFIGTIPDGISALTRLTCVHGASIIPECRGVGRVGQVYVASFFLYFLKRQNAGSDVPRQIPATVLEQPIWHFACRHQCLCRAEVSG